ncbi:MAG: hypothetical protein GW947_01625 [Candidatus Pacebacteria bacterium]|nr:hypothetical protein [Candidatus Paceibacterota bacterium]PIR59993.1 MAG: hypothetical protein COU68_03180 [Candidatus Pacebacteria bacterium CG10_big_fil_rev_8_21_14_0_10_45_6]
MAVTRERLALLAQNNPEGGKPTYLDFGIVCLVLGLDPSKPNINEFFTLEILFRGLKGSDLEILGEHEEDKEGRKTRVIFIGGSAVDKTCYRVAFHYCSNGRVTNDEVWTVEAIEFASDRYSKELARCKQWHDQKDKQRKREEKAQKRKSATQERRFRVQQLSIFDFEARAANVATSEIPVGKPSTKPVVKSKTQNPRRVTGVSKEELAKLRGNIVAYAFELNSQHH